MQTNWIRSMIGALHQGNKTSEALSSFERAMAQKVNTALDEKKISIASAVYPAAGQKPYGLAENSGNDLDSVAHKATEDANSHSQIRKSFSPELAGAQAYHQKASQKHKFAHDRHEDLYRRHESNKEYHGLLMQHHKNMMAFHDSQS